jgi:hypothetical protein
MRENGTLQFLILLLLVVVVYVGHCQGSTHQSAPPSLAPNTPFDGGIFLLVATGLIYGAKALYRKD